jgi:hypothetical protein
MYISRGLGRSLPRLGIKEEYLIGSFRMKHFNGLRKVTITFFNLALIIGVQEAQATSALNLACPEKYIATVTNVEDVESSATLKKVEVDFQIIQTLKGDSVVSKKIQVVKDGPIKFKSGEIYTLEANNVWLCSATVFSKL